MKFREIVKEQRIEVVNLGFASVKLQLRERYGVLGWGNSDGNRKAINSLLKGASRKDLEEFLEEVSTFSIDIFTRGRVLTLPLQRSDTATSQSLLDMLNVERYLEVEAETRRKRIYGYHSPIYIVSFPRETTPHVAETTEENLSLF